MRNELHTTSSSATPELSRISRWMRLGYALPGMVLAAGLLVTYFMWSSAHNSALRDGQDNFNFRVREVLERTEQRLILYTQVLRGGEGLFKASHEVDRQEFRAYVDALKLADNYPGIQGVGYSIVIPPEKRAQQIAEMHREGFREYTIKPAGKRDLYTSIIYLEPFAERNLRAFGYDMYSEPVRREAMERARDTDLPAMSGKVLLVQEAQQDIQAGFLIYLPVYRNDRPHVTLAQRRANLIGWVYSPFRMGDFIEGAYGEHAAGLDLDIYDGASTDPKDLMYDAPNDVEDPNQPPPKFRTRRSITVDGHTWTLTVHSTPSFEARVNTGRASLIANGGILTSLLLAVLVWMLVNGRRRAVRLAQQMNRELIVSQQALEESEGKLQAILDSAAIGIAWADKDGNIAYANREFTEMFGYTLADVPTVAEWNQRAYPDPDYRKRVTTKWEADIAAARENDTAIPPNEFDISCKDGSMRHVILTAAWVGSDILISFSDITERTRNEERLQQWAHIFEHAEWGIVVGTADGKHISLANPEFARVRGYTVEEVLQLSPADLFAPEERAKLPEHTRIAHEQGHHVFESVHLRKDGSTFPVLINVTAVKDKHGNALYRVVNVQDITDRKLTEKALLDSKAVLQTILDNSPYLIWLKDTAGRFIAVNQAFLESTGRQHMEEVLGKTDADLWPENLARKYQADDARVLASGEQERLEEQALHGGRPVWMETYKTPIFDVEGKPLGIAGFAHDITERKLSDEKVHHQAHYDLLTDLPNRILFSDRLEQAIAHAKRDKTHLAVMFLDLDRFKPVNDLFGHDVGDELLYEVARRILACVRESDTVARMGGDEFCVLLPGVEDRKDVSVVAEKILHTLRQPFQLGNNVVHIASSIGIALYPEDGQDESTLVKHADIAMYVAKEGGRDSFVIYHPGMSAGE